MKLGIFSDLHLDAYPQQIAIAIIDNILTQAREENVDILMFAGDMADGLNTNIAKKAWRSFETCNIRVAKIRGNHDMFGFPFADDHDAFEMNDTKFALATLWTDCHNDPFAEWWFKKNMPDARQIHYFSVAKMVFVHQEQKKFLFEANADVVMTHNPPSMLSVSPLYADQINANKAFMPELAENILDSKIKLWICGHTHFQHTYMLGNTKIVCNPLGQPGEIYRNPLDYRLHIEEV